MNPGSTPGLTQDHAEFAGYVAILGRGPGRSRALTRDEARRAFAMVLQGRADPHQVGAFLMLLRYRGEDAEEITGLVEAARAEQGGPDLAADLDWPSYGAGRTRGAPWFLLAALALARSGVRVLMHGSNAYSGGVSVAAGLGLLGMMPADGIAAARRQLAAGRFAYLPIEALSPAMAKLLDMRGLFGLRSPVNTVVRLLDPANAPAGVDGVFHPAYIDVHLGVAARMKRPALLVLKGGGGEAERNPAKSVAAHLWRQGANHAELKLPAFDLLPSPADQEDAGTEMFAAVWRGEAAPQRPVATVVATIALALLALDHADTPDHADTLAAELWRANRGGNSV